MPETEGPWFRRLGLAERQEIERLLDANASMSEIARKLGRSVSTITREITRNRRDDGYRVSPVSITRLCVHVRTCQVKGLCKGCWNRRCAGCRDVRCTNTCKRYERDICRKNTAAPFCCNGCASAPGCHRHRYRYSAQSAQRLSDARLVESRSGIDTTSERFEAMMETAKPLIKDNGQSIAHVFSAHRHEFPCSERTFVSLRGSGTRGHEEPGSPLQMPLPAEEEASREQIPRA